MLFHRTVLAYFLAIALILLPAAAFATQSGDAVTVKVRVKVKNFARINKDGSISGAKPVFIFRNKREIIYCY